MKNININDQLNFLKDLDELSEDENENVNKINVSSGIGREQSSEINYNIKSESQSCLNMPLLQNPKYVILLDEIEQIKSGSSDIPIESRIYNLISELNKSILEINKEINLLNIELRECYNERFPELSSIIYNPYEYAITVKSLGNELDVSMIDLSYLPSNIQLTLNIMSNSTTGKVLSKSKSDFISQLCTFIIKLNDDKKKILTFIESKMIYLCPNLSALVGTTMASKLVASAGGIHELAKIPSNNVLVMGAQKVNLEGFSSAGRLHMGYLSELEEVKKTPDKHKMQILRKFAGKVVLMARIDAYRSKKNFDNEDGMIIEQQDNIAKNSEAGDKLKEDIIKKMNKIIEPHQAVLKKPLPRPDEKPRRKRGGKRMRSVKDKFALTEMRLMKNRMKFGSEAQLEYRDTGKGLGLLGIGGNGSKMKTTVKVQKINTKKQKMLALESSQNNADKGLSSGLHSKVAFTPVEGIELINPELLEKKYEKVSAKYFSSTSGFSSVINDNVKKSSNTLYEI